MHRLRKHLSVPRLLAVPATAALIGAGLVATGSPAAAATDDVFTADRSVARNCSTAPVPGARGVDTTTLDAGETGLVRARLRGGGDWDLAVFDRGTGALIAASAGQRSNELAEGFVTQGQELLVQGCRYAGTARQVRLSVEFIAVPTGQPAERAQMVEVNTPTPADKSRLVALDLDLTEHATDTTVEVVLHGAGDEQRLRDAKFTWTVKIPDLAARAAANRAADQRFATSRAASPLPSGRTSYRRLFDYDFEMKDLARRFPTMVRAFVLPRQSVEGRDIGGIEIAVNARNLADGKPVFLNMGVHHAREWPAAEHPMEWAYELLNGFGRDGRTTALVRATRNIIVPIVNPDGFNISREAVPNGDFSRFDYEMKRKNCQIADAPPAFQTGVCFHNPAGRLRGTDPNRNYAGFWGGPGASTTWSSDTFRGGAPFSEPEIQAVRELVSSRQVTNLITNHTFSNLVIRPPGLLATRAPVDEPQYKALGQRMADHNGYRNIFGFQLYDTTGTTEDWSHWITGGLGFTFEIGPEEFHPPFEPGVVNEYLGLGGAAGAGRGGNREAYFQMLQSTADSAFHSMITGNAPQGWTLRANKTFQTPTSPVINPDGTVGEPIMYTDTLTSSFRTPGGRFSWAVNPSTRPFVAGRYGRLPLAPPQAPSGLTNPPGEPAENTGDPLTGPHESIPFTIQGMPEVDNGQVTIHIEWTDPNTDWDLYIVDESNTIVGQSAAFGDTDEDAVLIDPPAGQYRAIVVNFDQVDGAPFDDWSGGRVAGASPEPPVAGVREAWTVTCSRPNGTIAAVHQVIVDRGQRVDLGDACARAPKPFATD